MPDRFEVLELLGRGGEGAVYAAHDHRRNKRVALKRLADGETPPEWPRHPALVATWGVTHHLGENWLVMDFVDGNRLGPLPADDALGVLSRVADAIECLHRAGIVHGDVKPDNIVMRRDGTPVLVDCAIPRARFGTDGFRAPEVATGSEPTAAADAFGFAATAIAVIAGKRPDQLSVEASNALAPGWRRGLALDPRRRPSPRALVDYVRASTVVQLPKYTTRFVGREAEIAALATTTSERRIVTVTGIGGMGKTRLCVEFARRRAARFPGGVFFARAENTTLADVATALRMPASGTVVEDIATRLGGLASLLVLDTAEQPPDDVGAAAQALVDACARLVVVVASRVPVGARDEHVVPLLELTASDARALARDRGTRLGRAAAKVPLAIELDEAGGASVAEAAAAAVARLTPGDRRALLALRSFGASFSPAVARAALGTTATALARLQAMGIVAPDGDRLRLVDAIADATRPSPGGQSRLRSWVAEQCETGCPAEAVDHAAEILKEQPLDDAWLARVAVPLTGALASQRRSEEIDAILAAVIERPADFPAAYPQALRAGVDNWKKFIVLAEARLDDVADEGLRAVCEMRRLGMHASEEGDVRALRRIIKRLERSNDQWFLCTAWAELGVNLANLDRVRVGVAALERAVDIALSCHNHWVAGMAQNALGILARDRGDTDTAERMALAAIEAFERIGDVRRVADARANLALYRIEVGDVERGLDLAETALTEAASIGVRNIAGRILLCLAAGFADADPERALVLLTVGREFTKADVGRGAADDARAVSEETRVRAALGEVADEIIRKSRELDLPAAVAVALAP